MTPPGAVVAESAEAQHQQITIHPKLVELKDAQNTEDKGTCVSGKNDAQPETADAEKAPQIAFIKLFSTADSLDKLMIGLAVLGAVAGGALLPMFSLLFGKFADAFGNPDQSNFLRTIEGLALEFLYIGLGAFVAGFMDTCFWTWSGDRQANRLRGLYLASVLGQDIAYFDTSSTGTGGVLQGLNQDSGDVQSAISDKLGQLIKSVATFFTGFILAFTRGWDMTLVMLGCIPLMGVMGAFMSRTTSRAAERENAAYAKASAVAQQSISQIRTVASYTQEKRMAKEYASALDEPLASGIRQAYVMGLTYGGFQIVIYSSFAIALVYGAFRVAAGVYTGGTVLNVLMAVLLGGFSIMQGAPTIQYLIKGQVAGARIFHVIERRPLIVIDSEEGEVPPPNAPFKGELELKDMSFAYPARPDLQIFTRFNLRIPAGKTMALVGSSGSGKSTVVGLIERFYDPLEGAVLLDGVDIRRYNLKWLRSHVGLVSQEPTLFATTVLENIAMGRPGASEAEVRAAAAAANAHVFINRLPEGYNTQVGERGIQLSGGQKQRIAIARAVLKNPRILLLDEATSALDTQSERLVQAALESLAVGRTSVVVAHRLSTIRNAHCISVLQGGKIVEQGSHDELLINPDGAYSLLVQMQLKQKQSQAVASGDAQDIDPASDDLEDEIDLIKTQEEEEIPTQVVTVAVGDVEAGVSSAGGATGTTQLSTATSAQLKLVTKTSVAPGGADVTVARGSLIVSPEVKAAAAAAAGGSKGEAAAAQTKVSKAQAEKELEEAEAANVDMSFKRLAMYNKPEWHLGALGIAASMGAGAVSPAFALLFASMIAVFYSTDPNVLRSQAGFYAGMIELVGAGGFVCIFVQQVCFGIMAQMLALRVRDMLFKAILRQEIGWFDRDANSSGALSLLLSNDATRVRGAVADSVGLLLQNATTLAFGYFLALFYDWEMALVVTGILPLMVLAQSIRMKYQMGKTGGVDKLYADANQAATESISAVRVVQSYNMQESVIKRYNGTLASSGHQVVQTSLVTGLSSGFSSFMMFGAYSLVIYFGGNQIANGWTTFPDMLKAFMAILFAARSLAQSDAGFGDVSKAKSAVRRIFPIIDRSPLIDPCDEQSEADRKLALAGSESPTAAAGAKEPSGGKQVEDGSSVEGSEDSWLIMSPDKVAGELQFQEVGFSYPARPEVTIFKAFSLNIPAGQMMALVGESGSGKSTVVGLIERFYDPQAGTVLMDGVDIRRYNLKWLRQQIGLVSQEPLLFSGSIRDNITFGKSDATSEEVFAAAEAANAREFIERLPEGYDTMVGEGGIQLSGGQKQRIAIARAVIKSPKILLLDEATSALDATSESVVQAALDRIMVGRTSVVIAHRLSTVRDAACIAVVYNGVVLEKGSHDELMANGPEGSYWKLVQAQNQKSSS